MGRLALFTANVVILFAFLSTIQCESVLHKLGYHRQKRTTDTVPYSGQLVSPWERQELLGQVKLADILIRCARKNFPAPLKIEQTLSHRLSHGGNGNLTSGRVEVYLHGRWGIVCDDKWSVTDANVVCKQLGFTKGAKATTDEAQFGSGDWNEHDILMDDVACPTDAQTIQNCIWVYPSNCHQREAAGVVCHENTGCPEGWIAGPVGCYQMSSGYVTNRDFAVNRCASRGGHLVNIETEAENHFLSHVYAADLNGPVLTGGEKVDGKWLWEQVTEEPQNDDISETLSTFLTPVETFKWFPGWENGIDAEPSVLKKDRCLFLNNVFHHVNGSDVMVGYLFWEASLCKSTRKRMSQGFKYICEMPREFSEENVGCFSNDGSDYRGMASHTEKGTTCINWTEAPEINPTTYPDMGLGDHNFCRNPDRDDKPWCWTSVEGDFEFCSIPRCTVDLNEVTTRARTTETHRGTCQDDEFMCPDESCISSWWRCDIESDCKNGEDELNCNYKIDQFTKTADRTIRYHARETYVGSTNETCANLCLSRTNYVCRSFSFSRRTRECRLSHKNSLMVNSYPSRREDFYELKFYLDGCTDMFKCNNDRCIDQGLTCNGMDECGDLSDELNCVNARPIEVRLVGGSESSGSVEVNYLGQWGVICDDNWDEKDAKVICRMLGYDGKVSAVDGSYYGSGIGRFLLDEVKCLGNESSLDQCDHRGWAKHDCHHWEVAGVQCSLTTNLQIDLVGGDANSGRVELTYDGIRGTICDDNWDNKDAKVICKMLGYSDGKAYGEAYFGAANSSVHILLDNVECSGKEDTIADCARSDWLKHDCDHSEDAGVICSDGDIRDTTSDATTSASTFSTSTPSARTSAPSVLTSTVLPTLETNIDCYEVAANYRGTIAETEEGKRCQRWSRDTPHRHKYHDDTTFSDGSASAANNYCRVPDGDTVPWCYTTDRNLRWGYCNIPRCGASGSTWNQTVACGSRPLEAGRFRRDVSDLEDISDRSWNDEMDDDDDSSEIDISVYRKMERIMGGNIADYGMHPWQAALRVIVSRFRRLHAHKCGATIIGEYWILSAAHCFRGLLKRRVLIRTGDHHNLRREQYEQEFEAEEVFVHEGYNTRTYDYDIALVKLKPVNGHGIIFNEYVQPACLPSANTRYEAGKKCHISGWGTTETDRESSRLKSARVPLVDDLTCNRLYKWGITENMVCAGYLNGGTDSCTGDSGGPLVCEIDGAYTVMGVTSFGEGCAEANAPGVYTKVTSLITWVDDTIRENS